MEQPSRTCASRLNFCHPAGKNGFNQGEGGEVLVRPDRSKTIRLGDIAGAYHLPLWLKLFFPTLRDVWPLQESICLQKKLCKLD